MGNKAFLDSNVYLSLFNEDDSTHDEAVNIKEYVDNEMFEIFTSNYIINECLTIISQRFDHHLAVKFGEDMYKSQTRILNTGKKIEKIAWDIFQGNINKDISYADCTNIAFCIRYNIPKLITFDKHLLHLFNKTV